MKHITYYLGVNRAHQCLWNGYDETLKSEKELATHISEAHGVPNDWTSHRSMHYCYEHDVWCHSNRMWNTHLRFKHLQHLNGFCGLIRERGVVMIAAHCLFCLGDTIPLSVRFAQYHDFFDLHKHMRAHLAKTGVLKVCPYPRCEDTLNSDQISWTMPLPFIAYLHLVLAGSQGNEIS